MWVLVLRNTETKQSYIWESKQFKRLLCQFRRFVHRRNGHWYTSADQLLWEEYRKVIHPHDPQGWKTLLQRLTHLNQRIVTRNAAIGRYHRLKKEKEDANQRSEPKANYEDRDAQVQARRAPLGLRLWTEGDESQAGDSDRAQ